MKRNGIQFKAKQHLEQHFPGSGKYPTKPDTDGNDGKEDWWLMREYRGHLSNHCGLNPNMNPAKQRYVKRSLKQKRFRSGLQGAVFSAGSPSAMNQMN